MSDKKTVWDPHPAPGWKVAIDGDGRAWETVATEALLGDRYLTPSDREVLCHWFFWLQARQAERRLPLPPDFQPCSSCKTNLSSRYGVDDVD